ncbi:MBL fold metallo-hydrolase [Umezawaea beigongshangensis]|uniref:MBL fold metallo-hydrolase n=1 Tax=Umezawaea beigongshangensis TaxID=2780383 RepID=UPI0027DD26A4|nr:MBL fold metallo-hydrolase [Umezawaea beigongshangensis]
MLTALERPIHEEIARAHPENLAPPRCPVDLDLNDGDHVGGHEALVVHAVSGHTPGSTALHLPARAAVLTGDLAVRTPRGDTSLGPFDVDRQQAGAALRRLAALRPGVAGLGHGTPLLGDATAALAGTLDAVADEP